jgi:hypothetical protein
VRISNHGGIQRGGGSAFYEECLNVIGAHDNLCVECGLWWRELYDWQADLT